MTILANSGSSNPSFSTEQSFSKNEKVSHDQRHILFYFQYREKKGLFNRIRAIYHLCLISPFHYKDHLQKMFDEIGEKYKKLKPIAKRDSSIHLFGLLHKGITQQKIEELRLKQYGEDPNDELFKILEKRDYPKKRYDATIKQLLDQFHALKDFKESDGSYSRIYDPFFKNFQQDLSNKENLTEEEKAILQQRFEEDLLELSLADLFKIFKKRIV